MDNKITERRAFVWCLLLVGIIAISFSSIFVKWTDAPVSVIGMYRLLLTVIAITPFIFRYRNELRRISRRDWLLLGLSGLMLALHFLLWMGSLRYTTVASSTVILTLEPVLVVIGSLLFFQMRIGRKAVAAMGGAMVGAVLIGWGDFRISGDALFGDLLSLLGTLAVVVHMLLGQALRSRVSGFVYNYSVFLTAAAAFAVYNMSAGLPFFGYAAGDWLMFALMAAVPTVLGHMLFNWLMKYTGASVVSMAVLGEPVGSSLLAWWLLAERLTPLQAFAGVLLLAGVWLFLRSSGKGAPGHSSAEPGNGRDAQSSAAVPSPAGR